ncbi:MAG: hypothetical protein HY248_03810 [Fimbriimonas ginsengisoli]|uniref:Folate-binding protein YgfZ n=1 Tax=Fimbriimonas ginsengisoli TaxID=1005039 RepID=A0A931LWS6_FIMGI|nr:hypothetical protein [Fimbriimonas ginsengisoli]MBI3721656.1 hypothetical protein [Fimbriimonas ginsengisoli]
MAVDSYAPLHQVVAWLTPHDAALIELTGDDRLDWLQGQATNDLRGLEPGESKAFCLCEPTGQLLAICRVWVLRDRLLIETEAACAPAVLRRAEDMVVTEDVAARDLTPYLRVVSLIGPKSTAIIQQLAGVHPGDAIEVALKDVPMIRLLSPRAGGEGWDVWWPADAPNPLATRLAHVPAISHEAFEAARLEAGIPRFGLDWDSKVLPPELGPAFEAEHVSYNKGCYTGQEVLMRMHSRGHTNRTWRGLIADGPIKPGDPVRHPAREAAGRITSVARSPRLGWIAGAMLRNEAAGVGDTVEVISGEMSVKARVGAFPL